MAYRSLSPLGILSASLAVGMGVACTPLGGWLYSDPTFELSGVSIRYAGMPADTLDLNFTGCNLNDFDVDGLTVSGHLMVGGRAIGSLWSDRRFPMKMRDTAQVAVSLQIPRDEEGSIHAKGGGAIETPYELNGQVQVATPIGIRNVRIRQSGTVKFDSSGVAAKWTVKNARGCRPGQSILPYESTRRVYGPEIPQVPRPEMRPE
ncbi:MAG TPA: hypothetical protein VFO06_08280 [Gemmatimonadales bacterium]|nr:hypothetical protein [Gemmatimonadales bacterium]